MNSTFRLYIILILGFTLMLSSCCHEKKVNLKELSHFIDTTKVIKTICFGSCNKQWEDQSYWQNIRNENPDLWIWMGDIIYSDTEDMVQLKGQYDIQKGHKEYQDFIDSTMVVGVWDDHDYGVNDGGRGYPARKESRDLLFEFLDLNKSNLAWKREGAYQSYVFGTAERKVKVILLDGRYFQDKLEPDNKSEQRYLPDTAGTYLGETQWQWLEKELANSDAQLNLIVSGVQVISSEHFFEKWANFPKERERFFELLKTSGVQNPVVFSGDRHIAEVSKIKLDSTLTLYDVTSSGLTHSYEKADEENEYRIGPLVSSKNYGKIQIDWSGEMPETKISLHEINGTELFSFGIE